MSVRVKEDIFYLINLLQITLKYTKFIQVNNKEVLDVCFSPVVLFWTLFGFIVEFYKEREHLVALVVILFCPLPSVSGSGRPAAGRGDAAGLQHVLHAAAAKHRYSEEEAQHQKI